VVLNASGTNRSSTRKESDAVPHSPIVFQVSIKVASSAGNSNVRTVGRPKRLSLSEPSASTTWPCAPSQLACRQPLEKFHWPVRR